MAKRTAAPRTMSSQPAAPPSRTPALLAAASSLFLSSGLATLLWVWTAALERELASDADAVDLDEMSVVAWWAGDAALRWAVVSAVGSLCGVLGLLLRRSGLHRVFAVTTATDLLVTIFFTLTLALFTFSPSLSAPFGSFLCSSTFASDWTSAPALTSRSEHATSSWAGGIELVLWGLEACEDSWQTAMLGVLLGCVVAVVLRALGTWATWEMNSEMREKELRDRGEAWVDADEYMLEVEAAQRGTGDVKTPLALEETLGRPRASSTASTSRSGAMSERRSQTLPLPFALDSAKRVRSQTVTFGQSAPRDGRHAQLVFVPVMLDERGHPVYQPSSPTFAFPPYASPPRSRQNTAPSYTGFSGPSSSSSRSSSRSAKRSRQRSSSSSSSSTSSLSSPLSGPVFVDEPVEMSPPRTPIGQSTSTLSVEDKTSRRLRSRSEDVSLMSPPPP
ncbi:hypothetical protein JCM10450v2_000324 [Rhodotorula kratochvilovae]